MEEGEEKKSSWVSLWKPSTHTISFEVPNKASYRLEFCDYPQQYALTSSLVWDGAWARSRLPAGTAQNWQSVQVCGAWFDSSLNHKCVRFHLCLLHFLFLTSSRRNWKWQGNYHFTLNWSQSMWAGSKHGDTRRRGGKERWKKKRSRRRILGAFGDGSVICKTYRLKGGERCGKKKKKREQGNVWRDCVAGVPLMSSWQEPDLGAVRRRRFGFLFVWLHRVFPGPSRLGSETLWPTHGASL